MSCDIHFKLEYKPYKECEWRPVMNYSAQSNTLEAVYNIFAVLGNVRNVDNLDHIELRGFPKDAALNTKLAYCMIIDEDADPGFTSYNEDAEQIVTEETAKSWIDNGYTDYLEDDLYKLVIDPDTHDPNWCTASELRDAIKYIEENCENDLSTDWYALSALMDTYEKHNQDIRMVFWFDN